MSRRIEVELTSAREDGSWTWRAAGAREPRGIVASNLLPSDAKVGDVMRAEADFDLDGVSILSIAPKQDKKRNEAERIQIIGQPTRDEQLVTSTLTSRPKSDRRDGRGKNDRGDRPDRPDRPARRERKPREGADRERPKERSERPARTAERRPPRARPEEPSKPKPKRLRPARVHRAAVLEELPPEHRPIAEQVLAGDIPAVRQAIEKENATRSAAGQPTINGDQLLAIAEKLRPQLRTAEWRDKAEAAMADVDEIDLRDLRSVVVAADSAARDDDTRALATQLREALAKRVEAEQTAWVAELTTALDEGRVVRALRLSSRPPKAGVILDRALTTRLADGACESLTADAPAERWAAVLDATAFSPVRLAVKPQSMPEKPSDELVASVKKLASRLPLVATAFGIEVQDTPRSRTSSKPKPVPRPPRIPPPPPLSVEAVEVVEVVESVESVESVEAVQEVQEVEGSGEDVVADDS
ncbi:MAG: hypothetical protein QOI95_4005 [Acidimicrobiaceae bacterium]|jgi:hypothetical protein